MKANKFLVIFLSCVFGTISVGGQTDVGSSGGIKTPDQMTDAERFGFKGRVKSVQTGFIRSQEFDLVGDLIREEKHGCNSFDEYTRSKQKKLNLFRARYSDSGGNNFCSRRYRQIQSYLRLPTDEPSVVVVVGDGINYEIDRTVISSVNRRTGLTEWFITDLAKIGEMFAFKRTLKFDHKSRLVEEESVSFDLATTKTMYRYEDDAANPSSDEVYSNGVMINAAEYTYQDFDRNGNWTKRSVRSIDVGRSTEAYVNSRTITYHAN